VELKSESLFAEIKRALDEEDVEGLLALDCPSNEYDEEARLIADRVRSVTKLGENLLVLADAERIVEEVCNKQFGPFEGAQLEIRRPIWRAVAKRIVE